MIKRLLLLCSILWVIYAQAQVTTSSITGIIRNSKNEPLTGATIKATHVPSGTVYSIGQCGRRRFTYSNMRVGGPYRLEVSYVGYNTPDFMRILTCS